MSHSENKIAEKRYTSIGALVGVVISAPPTPFFFSFFLSAVPARIMLAALALVLTHRLFGGLKYITAKCIPRISGSLSLCLTAVGVPQEGGIPI